MSKVEEKFSFRQATFDDQENIWEILQQAIERRKIDLSNQWQDGYPNPASIKNDIENNFGFVLEAENEIIGYAAIIDELEPAYEIIEGQWLSNQKYMVVHRVAVSNKYIGKGIATIIFHEIEKIVISRKIHSIKVDTNFDNIPMLKILDKLGYTYCGEVYFRGSARKAFQKLLI